MRIRNPAGSPFGAIFRAEVLLNTRRVVPYAMATLFAGNALLWWGWGPAASRGWATNSDAFIAGMLPVFSFMTLPLFTVLIMGDPVIRDFRTGIASLIFSKPVSRAEYLLGKFFGNFFVLVCCQSAFVLTLFVLQGFRRPGMIVQDVRTLPYIKHFLVFVVISHLVLAAFFFTVGTLTRNPKIVYGLGVAFYPLYVTYQAGLLRKLPARLRVTLDPLLMNWGEKPSSGRSAEWFNQLVVVYDFDLVLNRVAMILAAGICLTILYVRFTIAERQETTEKSLTLGLLPTAQRLYRESESFSATSEIAIRERSHTAAATGVLLPSVEESNTGLRSNLNKLIAALGTEFRLLRYERSLVVVLPLAVIVSFVSLPFGAAFSGETYSASFASSTASGLLVFLLGVIVFYTGESMHRDREVRVEPVIWSTPVTNSVLLLSKFLTTISLALVLIVLAGLTAIATQLLRGHTPVEISAYLVIYSVILFPTIVFISAASIAVNVLMRDKYFAYAVSIATATVLFYIYGQGYNGWLYNPALYQLWTFSDLSRSGSGSSRILTHRMYCMALSCVCLALAHLAFRRRSAKGFITNGRLSSTGWALVATVASGVAALVTGLLI